MITIIAKAPILCCAWSGQSRESIDQDGRSKQQATNL
jgi:hypothetical protein